MSRRTIALTCAFFAGSLFGQSVIINSPGRKPAFATQPRPRNVDHRDPRLFDLDDALLRQQLA